MYVKTGAWADGEEAADLGKVHRRARAVSVMAPPSAEQEGALEASATFLQKHWWLWPVMVVVCGAVAGAIGFSQATRVDGQ